MTTFRKNTNYVIPDLAQAQELFDHVMRYTHAHPGRSRPDLFAPAKNLSPEAFYHGLLFPLMFEARLYDPLLNRPGALLRSFLRELTESLSFPNAYPVPQHKGEFFAKSFSNFELHENQQKTLKNDARNHIRHRFLSMLGQSINAFGSPKAWWTTSDGFFARDTEFKVVRDLLKNKEPIPKDWAKSIYLSFVLHDTACQHLDNSALGGSVSAALVYAITRRHDFMHSVQRENDQLVARFKDAPDKAIPLGDIQIKAFLSFFDMPWDHYTLIDKKQSTAIKTARLSMDVFHDKTFQEFPDLADGIVKTLVNQTPPAQSPFAFFLARNNQVNTESAIKFMQSCFKHCSDQSIADLMAFCKECSKSDPDSAFKHCEAAYERYTQICKREIEAGLEADQDAGALGQRAKKASKI